MKRHCCSTPVLAGGLVFHHQRREISISRGDSLAVTHADKIPQITTPQICTGYQLQAEPNRLTDYFEHKGQTITGIHVKTPTDSTHQTQLTQYLFQCEPMYTPVTGDYLNTLEQTLDIPISIISDGMTAEHKTLRSPLARK